MILDELGVDDQTEASSEEQRVLGEFAARARASLRHSQDWRTEARDLFEQVAGRQWDDTDEAAMREAQRPMVTFNLMAKFLDAVVGLQINNRQEIRCYPRRNGVAAISDLATGALAWTRGECDAEFEETDAGHDCLLTGMGWTETFLDDSIDPDGYISKERRDPIEMLWDPMARKKNLIDGRYVIRLKRMTRGEYRDQFGEAPSGNIGLPGVEAIDLDPTLHVIEQPQDYQGEDSGGASEIRGGALVADYQFWRMEPAFHVEAQLAGQAEPARKVFSPEEWTSIEASLKQAQLPYKAESIKRRVYYRCWIACGGIKGKIKRLAYQEGFTYEAITGKRDRNKNYWYGIGRALVDPQKWVNKFFSSIIWQLMVNPKGGLLAEEDAFTDQDDAEASWADPSKITFAAPGAIQNGKIQPKPAGNYPQGMDRLMQFSMEALPEVSGLNAEMLGLTNRDQPGVVEAQRKQGALAIVAWYFDALHRHYKRSGRLALAMIRDYIADGRLIRIAGQEGAKYVPLLKESLQDSFDIIVDEAPTSVNMRERVWLILQQVIPMALQAGIRVPKEVLDYVPIPEDLAQKWKQNLEPAPEAQQLEQRAAVAEVAKTEGQAAKEHSAAKLNEAKAQEIATKAPIEAAAAAAQVGTQLAGA